MKSHHYKEIKVEIKIHLLYTRNSMDYVKYTRKFYSMGNIKSTDLVHYYLSVIDKYNLHITSIIMIIKGTIITRTEKAENELE
jgi:hypothetical protein